MEKQSEKQREAKEKAISSEGRIADNMERFYIWPFHICALKLKMSTVIFDSSQCCLLQIH